MILFTKVLVLIPHNKIELQKEKNRHLLKIARALLFTTNVPNYLWGEAILTTTHLINRIPLKILNFKTSLHIFINFFSNSRIPFGLLIRLFGCTVYIHNYDQNHEKLESKAIKCVL